MRSECVMLGSHRPSPAATGQELTRNARFQISAWKSGQTSKPGLSGAERGESRAHRLLLGHEEISNRKTGARGEKRPGPDFVGHRC